MVENDLAMTSISILTLILTIFARDEIASVCFSDQPVLYHHRTKLVKILQVGSDDEQDLGYDNAEVDDNVDLALI